MNLVLAVSLSLLVALSSPAVQAQGKNPLPEAGETKPGYYRNDYFGFSLAFPDTWRVVQPRKPNDFQAEGGDALVRNGVLNRRQVSADQSNTHNLFGALNAGNQKNGVSPQIIMVAEGIHEGAPFKTAEEYLAHTLKLMEGIRTPKMAVVAAPREAVLGGRTFWRVELARGDVRQSYYATISKNFAVSIVVSGGDLEQLKEANDVIRQIQFNKPK